MIRRKNNYQNLFGVLLVLLSILSSSIFTQFSLNLNVYQYFNLTYLLIYFFTFNNHKYFSLFSMFLIGIISDSISGTLFGTSALAYMVIYKMAVYQETIRLRSIFLSEWLALGIALFIAYIVVLTVIYLSGVSFNLLTHLYNWVGSFFLYPFIWLILKSFIFNHR